MAEQGIESEDMSYDLQQLDFDAIRRLLETYTSTPYGADAVRHLEPPRAIETARQMQRSITAARRMLEETQSFSLNTLPNIRPALRQASSEGAILNEKSLQHIQQVIAQGCQLVEQLQDWPPIYPHDVAHLQVPEQLSQSLHRLLGETGELQPQASKELEQLCEQFDKAHTLAQEAAEKIINNGLAKFSVADKQKIYWQKNRVFLVIRDEVAERIKGVRRGTAPTAAGQLIEPIELMGVNNQLDKLAGQIHREQQRLLRQCTDQVRQYLEHLNNLLDALTWIDLALAGGRMSRQMNAHAPHLTEEPQVQLQQAYHPMLLLQFMQGTLKQPVPISLKIAGKHQFLMVTGPNTGGKTVVLKTLGLLVMMSLCGLHIPAEEDCTIGWYTQVLVDMGDRQSLYHQLSTFAAHVEMMKRMLVRADEASLLLFDELGTGTDPDEGAALAMALLDELCQRGAQGLVNTHLSPLKDYATQHAHIQNAAMIFNPQTFEPTYKLKTGETGLSLGLIIAQQNGLDEQVVSSARDYLQQISSGQS